jgi:hypothetical protein
MTHDPTTSGLRARRSLRFAAGALFALHACNGEHEVLQLAGYTVTDATPAARVYRNAAHGYQVTLPPGIELQEHRNGQFVIVPSHGTLFGIWIHAEASPQEVEAKLLSDFERWCGNDPECARERAGSGGSLRLVPVAQGPFTGFKAVARDLPDEAPARCYAFRSPQLDGYFGFELTPSLAGALFESLQPLAPAPPAAK